MRTRPGSAAPKKAAATPAVSTKKPKGPDQIVLKGTCNTFSSSSQLLNLAAALPLTRAPVYIEISNLIAPPEGAETQVAALDPEVFAAPIRRDILQLCLIHHLDGKRQGSANTKTRGEVRGSGRKIRPQKGTGRARLGDGQSPMLKGGGVAFGPKPRDFSTELPRKVRAMGMRVALSSRVREESLMVVDSFDWPGVKTKGFKIRFRELSWGRCLFVVGRGEETFKRIDRVSRVEDLHVIRVQDLDIHTLLRWPRLVLDVEAVEWLETKWHASAWSKARTTFQSAPPLLIGHHLPPPSQPASTSIVATL